MMLMCQNRLYFLNLALWNLVALVCTQRLQLLREEPSLSSFDQQTIINAHNHYRRRVGASNMQLMQWDVDLQKASEDSSRSCPVFRSQQKYSPKGAWRYISENIYGSSASENFNTTKAVDAWFSEGQTHGCGGEYTCCEKACNDYSQIVWAKTNRIGCGVSLCAQSRFEADTYLLVCSYGPAGNIFGERAYEAGTACSKCPFEAPDCARGLCAKCDADDSSRQMCQNEPFYQTVYGTAADRFAIQKCVAIFGFAVVTLAAWQGAMLV